MFVDDVLIIELRILAHMSGDQGLVVIAAVPEHFDVGGIVVRPRRDGLADRFEGEDGVGSGGVIESRQ